MFWLVFFLLSTVLGSDRQSIICNPNSIPNPNLNPSRSDPIKKSIFPSIPYLVSGRRSEPGPIIILLLTPFCHKFGFSLFGYKCV